MFIQILPACVIIHTLSSSLLFCLPFLSLSFMPFCFFLNHFGINPPLQPAPLYPMCTITHFFSFLSGDIYLFLPCLLPAHSSQSLSPDISSCSLSSFTPRLLSNFPALSPIHLPLRVPASLDHDIVHSLPLSTSILSQNLTQLPPPPLLYLLSFFHSFTLNGKQVSETNSRRCKSVFNRGQAYISPFSTIHTLSICT